MSPRPVFVGIDPGAAGALVGLTRDRQVAFALRWKGTPDADDLEWLRRDCLPHAALAALEVVRSFGAGHRAPPQSLVKLGRSRGFWEGFLAACGVAVHDVQPKEWQKALVLPKGLPRSERGRALKRAAVALVKDRHPGLIGPRCHAESPYADAALMADVARCHAPLLDQSS